MYDGMLLLYLFFLSKTSLNLCHPLQKRSVCVCLLQQGDEEITSLFLFFFILLPLLCLAVSLLSAEVPRRHYRRYQASECCGNLYFHHGTLMAPRHRQLI